MKNFVLAALFTLFATMVWAAGPSQQWRLDITGAESGNVEVAEIELRTAPGGASVTDLFRNYTFEESAPAGSLTWSLPHNLGTRIGTTDVTVFAYAVDVVAPGDWFYNTTTLELYQRNNLAYDMVSYTMVATLGAEPASPEVGDVVLYSDTSQFAQWDSATWAIQSVTPTTAALPVPDEVAPTSITKVPGSGLPATGAANANNTVDIVFPQAVVGAASVRGASFDTPTAGRPVTAIPVIEHFERRAAAAAFDGNKGSWIKSKRAPSQRSPLTLQYTYWVGDPSRYPNVVEYTITAKTKDSAPKSWKLLMYKDGQWITVDQQAAIRFEDGETRVFTID